MKPAHAILAGRRLRHVASAALVAALGTMIPVHAAVAASPTPWTVIGRQGVVRFVIVPAEHATDEAAYQAQITQLCEPEHTCFLNFYTNPTGAPAALPLSDAIAAEATATFRRSAKNGVEMLMWSCRMKLPTPSCF